MRCLLEWFPVPEMRVASTNILVEASKGVDRSYSFTSSPVLPITNILAPSLENAMPVGLVSCSDMGVASTKDRVEASKGVDSVVLVYVVSGTAYHEHLGAVA